MDKAMLSMGSLHESLNKLPVVGERIARGVSWLMSFVPMLGGMRKTDSIEGTLEQMRKAGDDMGFPFQFGEIEGDRFVLTLPHCPYGFTGPEHERPCDTAMDMDRLMLRRCGAELTIDETIPKGASACKMTVRQL
jgi:hypothetical protein